MPSHLSQPSPHQEAWGPVTLSSSDDAAAGTCAGNLLALVCLLSPTDESIESRMLNLGFICQSMYQQPLDQERSSLYASVFIDLAFFVLVLDQSAFVLFCSGAGSGGAGGGLLFFSFQASWAILRQSCVVMGKQTFLEPNRLCNHRDHQLMQCILIITPNTLPVLKQTGW